MRCDKSSGSLVRPSAKGFIWLHGVSSTRLPSTQSPADALVWPGVGLRLVKQLQRFVLLLYRIITRVSHVYAATIPFPMRVDRLAVPGLDVRCNTGARARGCSDSDCSAGAHARSSPSIEIKPIHARCSTGPVVYSRGPFAPGGWSCTSPDIRDTYSNDGLCAPGGLMWRMLRCVRTMLWLSLLTFS